MDKLDHAYRGWRISYDPPPIPTRNCDWQFHHEDYDGPEDNRCGHAHSLKAAKAEIDEWIYEHFNCQCSAPCPDDCMALVCEYRKYRHQPAEDAS